MDFICIDFLNSDWRDWRGDGRRTEQLDKQEWLQKFLQRWGMEADLPLDKATRAALGDLRERMRSMVESLAANRKLNDADIQTLNQAMSLVPSYAELVQTEKGFELKEVSSATGWTYVMGQIAVSFVKLLTEHDVRRIKICDNINCQWIYYDESRNRSRRWCDDKACGNLLKVRRFRERHK